MADMEVQNVITSGRLYSNEKPFETDSELGDAENKQIRTETARKMI